MLVRRIRGCENVTAGERKVVLDRQKAGSH